MFKLLREFLFPMLIHKCSVKMCRADVKELKKHFMEASPREKV